MSPQGEGKMQIRKRHQSTRLVGAKSKFDCGHRVTVSLTGTLPQPSFLPGFIHWPGRCVQRLRTRLTSLGLWMFSSAALQGADDEIAGIILIFMTILAALVILLMIAAYMALWLSWKATRPAKRVRSAWDLSGIVFSGLLGFALLFFGIPRFVPCLSNVQLFCAPVILGVFVGMIIYLAISAIIVWNLGHRRKTRT